MNLNYGRDAAPGVGDLDAESLGLGDDFDALAGRDGVADPNQKVAIRQYANPSICELSCNILGSERAVVHQEQFNIVGVLDEERLVARRHHMAGLLVGTVSNLKPAQILVNSCSNPRLQRTTVPRAWQPVP